MENKKSSTRDREITISRKLNAPVELVWELWTNPEHIVNWWGPNGFTNTISTMNVVPGGEWHLVMHGPDGTDFVNKSVFKELVLHQKIVFEHSAPNFISTITFEEQGDKTGLTWHMVFETKELFMAVVKAHNAAEGLKQNVVKLEAYLQGLKSKS